MKLLLACLFLLTHAAAETEAPSDAALGFLDQLRESPGEWADHCVLFPGTTKEKQTVIGERLKRLAYSLKEGDLRIVESKVEGSLAAVIISQIVEFDPGKVQIHAIGLLLKDDDWIAAPVVGSFENTGIRYDPDLSEPAASLEAWMLARRSHHLARLQNNILADLLADVRAAKSRDDLLGDPPEKIVNDFIRACSKGDVALALAHLGGLEDPLPETWVDTVNVTSRALRTPWRAQGQWKELVAPYVLRTVVQRDIKKDFATISFGEFNPDLSRPGRTEWRIRHFGLIRNDAGFWRLRLPVWLLEDDDEDNPLPAGKSKLHKKFPAEILASLPTRYFDTPEELLTAFTPAITDEKFLSVLPFYSQPTDHEKAGELLSSIARFWRRYHHTDDHFMWLEVKFIDDEGWAICTTYDPRRPEISGDTLLHLPLNRSKQGWSLSPIAEPSIAEDLPESLETWAAGIPNREEAEWLALAGLDHRLGGLAAQNEPDEAASHSIATKWIEALASGDLRATLSCTTAFDDETASKRLFDFLGHELSGSYDRELLGIHHQGRWTGASIRHRSTEKDGKTYYLLHPIVATPDGPRILPEAILYQVDSRPQRFLNDTVWKRLRTRLPEGSVAELEALFQDHETLCKSLIGDE